MMYNELAELDIVGAALLNPPCLASLDGVLEPQHFYVPVLSEAYRLALEEFRASGDVSPHHIAQKLSGHPAMQGENPTEWLARIAESGMRYSSNNYRANARLIYSLFAKRQVSAISEKITQAMDTGDTAALAEWKAKLEAVSLEAPQSAKTTALDQLRQAYRVISTPGAMLSTGFRQWDFCFGGLSRGARYVLAAYPGAGKTAFALQVGRHVAHNGARVRYLSFEEDISKLWTRVISHELKIAMRNLRGREGADEDTKALIVKGSDGLSKPDFVMFYRPATVGEMIELCGPCDLVVVDGVSSFPAPPEFTKVDKAGWVGDQCAKLADHTGAAVLMLSHINSDAVKTGPSLAGIYGGQAAAFDPEGIMEIRRANADESGPYRTISGLVLKNRYGEVGVKMKFNFQGELMTYYEPAL